MILQKQEKKRLKFENALTLSTSCGITQCISSVAIPVLLSQTI